MHTTHHSPQAIEKEVVKVISTVTKLPQHQLLQVRDLTKLGLDIVDVVDVILKLEKKYQLNIPDEVPVYSVDDFVNFVYSHQSDAVD